MSSQTQLIAARGEHRRGARVPRALLFVILLLFLLAPYFSVGAALNGGFIGLGLLLLLTPSSMIAITRQRWVYTYFLLFLALGAYSGLVASLYGEENLSFLKIMISLVLYIAAGFAIGRFLFFRGVTVEAALTTLLKLALAIIVLNSVVILVSFLVPAVKTAVESVLADASNIDYKTHEFKLRGLASAGGAGLSVMHALGVWIALALYKQKYIGIFSLALSCVTIAVAMLFIGRTGFILIALALLLYIVTTTSATRWLRLLLVMVVFGAGAALAWTLLVDLLPPEVQKYSVLFLLQGVEGVQNEGTVGMLSEELFLPQSLAHLLFGIGYYNGENILGVTTDPGYMKSLLSLGLPLALLLYGALIHFLAPLLRSATGKTYVLPLVALLLVAEIKEPFFYAGYAARLLFMLGGVWMAFSAQSAQRRTSSTGEPQMHGHLSPS